MKAELADELFVIVEGLLAGHTQRELADILAIDERTVRRRLARVRKQFSVVDLGNDPKHEGSLTKSTITLPRVGYNEFVLGKWIGSGGFGKIYRATMQSDERIVAVKFLRKAFWQNEVARQTFIREINIASQINHSGVIRYLGYGESPHGGPYVISEWIDGRSLQISVADLVTDVRLDGSSTNPTTIRFVGWLRQICGAIHSVHQAGLIHGDLTTSNVLVDAQDHITITDFGFSQAFTESASPILGGTLGFAAPEQIDPAFGSISVKTDIYAIGGLVHWLLFGRPPNAGQSLEDALSTTLSHCEPEASTYDAVPEVFRDILVATLRKSPADRTMGLEDIVRILSAAANEIE